jgi:[protein-PII] uridylyltransferase
MTPSRLAPLYDQMTSRLAAGDAGASIAKYWSSEIEMCVRSSFEECATHNGTLNTFVVFAQGGLARGDLTPQADVDLLLVPISTDELGQEISETIAESLRQLWDSGLSLGHALRSVAEIKTSLIQDTNAATALLEARPIAGDMDCGLKLLDEVRGYMTPDFRQDLLRTKIEEIRHRRRRYGDTVYLAEPDVKNSPGGIREIHSLTWISQLLAPIKDPKQGKGPPWHLVDLFELGFIDKLEHDLLQDAQSTMIAFRVGLHLLVGRKENRLLFEYQEKLAEMFQISALQSETKTEAFMRLYFKTALRMRTTVDEIIERLLEQNELEHLLSDGTSSDNPVLANDKKIEILDYGFRAQRNRIYTDDPAVFEQRPHRLVDMIRLASERDYRISATTKRRLRSAVNQLGRELNFQAKKGARSLLRICRSTSISGRPFTSLLEYGLIGHLLEDMDRLESRLKQDGYHAYTTDAHICRCADMALHVASGVEPIPVPMEASFRRTSRFHLLVLGALFHDMGKGLDGDHSQSGIAIARREAAKMGLPPGEIAILEFMVEHHLLLSKASQRRDVNDPAVLHEIAEIVRTVERLDLLALLTWVDIASVAPETFTDWKGRLLGTAVDRVRAYLLDPEAEPRIRQDLEGEVRRTAQIALQEAPDQNDVSRFITGASYRSLGSRFESDLRDDFAVFAKYIANPKAPIIDYRLADGGCAHELRIVCPESPDMLSRLADALSAQGANILHAHADSRGDEIGFHAFRIDDGKGNAHEERTLGHMIQSVGRAAAGEQLRFETHHRLERTKSPMVEPKVRLIEGSDSWGAVILEVRATDRPGLMAELTRAIFDHGWRVVMAKVNTDGSRARDVFFLVPQENVETDGKTLHHLRSALEENLREKGSLLSSHEASK